MKGGLEIPFAFQACYVRKTSPLYRMAAGARVKAIIFMSQHSSLRGVSALGAKRNVLKRFERVEILKKRGQWKQGDRVTGLRKTKGEP